MREHYHYRIYLPADVKFPKGQYVLYDAPSYFPEYVDTNKLEIIECTIERGKLSKTVYKMKMDERYNAIFEVDYVWRVLSSEIISKDISYYKFPVAKYSKF